MNYWLLKSEPRDYSITDLQREGQTLWEGVRNYQARNFLGQMAVGDLGFFYHSNTKPPGIVGLMRVAASHLIDPSQFDSGSPYYDPKARRDSPRWQTVAVEFVEAFPRIIALDSLKRNFSPEELSVVRRGNRLSVMPVSKGTAERLLAIARSLGKD